MWPRSARPAATTGEMGLPRIADQRTRTVLTAVMDVLLVIAVLLLARLAIGFFSVTATSAFGAWYLRLTAPVALPVAGGWAVRTPYGGAFLVDTGIVILGLLVLEWLLSVVRRDIGKEKEAEA